MKTTIKWTLFIYLILPFSYASSVQDIEMGQIWINDPSSFALLNPNGPGHPSQPFGPQIDQGNYGKIHSVPFNPEVVVKLAPIDQVLQDAWANEVYALKKVGYFRGAGVQVDEHGRVNRHSGHLAVFMKRIHGTPISHLAFTSRKQLDHVFKLARKELKRLHSKQIVHRDAHSGNFIYNQDTDKVHVIDFGLSMSVKDIPQALQVGYKKMDFVELDRSYKDALHRFELCEQQALVSGQAYEFERCIAAKNPEKSLHRSQPGSVQYIQEPVTPTRVHHRLPHSMVRPASGHFLPRSGSSSRSLSKSISGSSLI